MRLALIFVAAMTLVTDNMKYPETKRDALPAQQSHQSHAEPIAIAAVFAAGEDASAQLAGEMSKRRLSCNTSVDIQCFLLAAQRPLIVQQTPRRIE